MKPFCVAFVPAGNHPETVDELSFSRGMVMVLYSKIIFMIMFQSIDWVEFLETWVPIIKDIFIALSAAAASIAAIMGINEWRKEFSWKNKATLAGDFLEFLIIFKKSFAENRKISFEVKLYWLKIQEYPAQGRNNADNKDFDILLDELQISNSFFFNKLNNIKKKLDEVNRLSSKIEVYFSDISEYTTELNILFEELNKQLLFDIVVAVDNKEAPISSVFYDADQGPDKYQESINNAIQLIRKSLSDVLR